MEVTTAQYKSAEQLDTLAISSMSEHPSGAASDSTEQSAIDVRRRQRYAELEDSLKPGQHPIAKAPRSNNESLAPSGFAFFSIDDSSAARLAPQLDSLAERRSLQVCSDRLEALPL